MKVFLCCLLMAQTLLNITHASEQISDSFGHLAAISVQQRIQPEQESDIAQAVAHWDGKISIGGARYSMGGQTALDNSLHIDLRHYNKVISLSVPDKTITVQSGISWREIQEYIDPYNLSVSIMQTYANFSVGGSLSVNVHGRYVGATPVIGSVKSFRLVLANGQIITASPTENATLFYGAIGGYGGLGVITEVTLQLTDNTRLKRFDRTMPLSSYKA